jgi:hypothetical protein
MTQGTSIKYSSTQEFSKDLKKLIKKYPTLLDDLKLVQVAAIELFHVHKINNGSVFPLAGFCANGTMICKIKKFACKSLKGRGVHSGIRVIYVFRTHDMSVVLLEMYCKADQAREDEGRIKRYLEKCAPK